MSYNIRLLIDCPDHKGLIAAISSFIALHNGNILSADQHVSDPPNSTFFMRMEIESKGFGLGRDEFDAAFAPLARQHGMNWRVSFTDRPKRMAILVSKQGHCLIDLLWRWEAGELDAEIPLVISNHADLAAKVEAHGIPFHHLPVTKASKAEQEAKVEKLLQEHNIDLVVLARYMQILSPQFLESYRQPVINIHHSFLPAFIGANPYQQAYRARGENHRGHGPLRHGGARCRAHPQSRCCAYFPPRWRGRYGSNRTRGRASRPGPGRTLASRRPSVGAWNPHGCF